MPTLPSLMSQKQEDVLVVYFTDMRILDESTITSLGRALLDMADKADEGKLLLNFREVKFMSSAMLGKLMQLNKRCKALEVDLKLCEIAPEILQIFKMMKLNKVLDLQKTEEKALKAFSKKKGFFG